LDRVRTSYEEEKRRRDSTLRDRHQELALRRQTQVKKDGLILVLSGVLMDDSALLSSVTN